MKFQLFIICENPWRHALHLAIIPWSGISAWVITGPLTGKVRLARYVYREKGDWGDLRKSANRVKHYTHELRRL